MLFQSSTVMALSLILVPFGAAISIDPGWVVALFLVLVVVISLMILGNRQVPSVEPLVTPAHGHDHEAHAAGPEKVEIAEIPLLDDLTLIEGIGPKIAEILSEEGINTFLELANSDVDTLDHILDEANLSFADPSTWPEQARLANLQEWKALEAFQAQLKGGRKES
jgi:predicted flap endonuclease-1-like 5' DNA nuclease